MTPNHFLLRLRSHFAEPAWSWLIAALFQDQTFWHALTETKLGEKALSTLPGVPETWTPAALGLLACGEDISTSQLQDASFSVVDSQYSERAELAWQNWLAAGRGETGVARQSSVEEITLAGLALREIRRKNESWQFLSEIINKLPFEQWSTFACLYGMISDPYEFLYILFMKKPDLAAHTFLSNPLSPEDQTLVLRTLLSELPHPQQAEAFAAIKRQRHDTAMRIQDILTQSPNALQTLETNTVVAYLERQGLIDIHRLIELQYQYDLSNLLENDHEVQQVIFQALGAARRIQASYLSRLADVDIKLESQDGQKRENRIKHLQKAVDLDPSNSTQQALLLKALINNGQLEEAASVLKFGKIPSQADDPKIDGTVSEIGRTPVIALQEVMDPNLIYQAARLAQASGQTEEACRLADQAALLVVSPPYRSVDFAGLAQFLLELGMERQAIEVAERGLADRPHQPMLIRTCIQSCLNLNKTHPAVSMAVVGSSITTDDPDASALLVESLQASQEWQSALLEERKLINSIPDPTAQDYLILAECALGAHEIEEAEQACQSALELQTQNSAAFYTLGQIAVEKQDYQTAESDFKHALQLDSQNGLVWTALAKLYKSQQNHQLALETLRSGMQAAPESIEIYLTLGQALLEENAPTLALVPLRKAQSYAADLIADSLNSNIYSRRYKRLMLEKISLILGNTLRNLGHLEESKNVLLQVCDLNTQKYPSDPEIAYSAALTNLGLGDKSTALLLLEYVLSRQPENQIATLEYARILIQSDPKQENYQTAISILEKLLGDQAERNNQETAGEPQGKRLDLEQTAEGYALLAEAKAITGELTGAIQAYRQALNSPLIQSPHWRYRLSLGLGKTASALNEHETAITTLLEARELVDPSTGNDPDLYRCLSESYEALELTTDAYESACEALNTAESDLDILDWFACQCLSLARHPASKGLPLESQAIYALGKAAAIAPWRMDLLVRLGQTQAQAGRSEEALNTLEQLVNNDDDPDLQIKSVDLYQAALILEQLGQPDQASVLLYRAIHLADGEEIDASSSLIQLLIELARSQEQAGDLGASLQACDQAITTLEDSADPRLEQAYLIKASLQLRQADLPAAQNCLELACECAPDQAETYYLLATVQIARQETMSALLNAEKAVLLAGQAGNNTFEKQARLLACQAAVYLRLFDYGLAIFDNLPEQSMPYEASALITELALDLARIDRAAGWLVNTLEQRPHAGRSLVLQGRLQVQQEGNSQTSRQLFQAALHEPDLDSSQTELSHTRQENPSGFPPQEYQAILERLNLGIALRSLANALFDDNQWNEGMKLLDQIIVQSGNQLAITIDQAQAILHRAETQQLCKSLQITQAAPGDEALESAAAQAFFNCIKTAHEILEAAETNLHATIGEAPSPSSENIVSGEIKGALARQIEAELNQVNQYLQRLMLRGQMAFDPDQKSVQGYQAFLAQMEPDVDEIARLVWGLVKADLVDEAIMTGSHYRHYPFVALELAWLQDCSSALATLNTAREHITRLPAAGLNPLPLLLAEAGLISYTKSGDQINYLSAYKYLESALDIWPDEPYWHALAAEIVQHVPASETLSPIKTAITHLLAACKLETENPTFHFNLGKAYLANDQPQLAKAELEETTRIMPADGEAWFILAQIQTELGEIDQAAQSADHAIENLSDKERTNHSLDALLLRAEIALLGDNPRGALSRAQSILNVIPDHPAALYMVSRALAALNQPGEALAALDQAIQHGTPSLEMELERAALIKQANGAELAIEALQPLTEVYPQNAELFALLADLYCDTGAGEAGLQAARLALEFNRDELSSDKLARLHFQIGWQLHRMGQLDQAIYHLGDAIRISPQNLEYYLELGRAHQDRRQNGQAIEIYQVASKLAPSDYRPYFQAGLAFKDSKDYTEAEAMFRRAVHLAPQEAIVHRQLAAVVALNLVHNRRLPTAE